MPLTIVWARQAFPEDRRPSLFLAGPTPRSAAVASWRPGALAILERLGFDGAVFLPETEGAWHGDYLEQVDWEEAGLTRATIIVFWVPRDLETLPGFTTNIEWGTWQRSGKVVLGAPPDAPKMTYMRHYANKYGVPTAETLEDTLKAALRLIDERR